MNLRKIFIEFFLNFGATPLVISALIMFVYVVYHISTIKSIEEYRVGKFVVIWIIIALPQIYGLHLAERYKSYLPIHQVEMTTKPCMTIKHKRLIKGKKCVLNGRIVEDQNNRYLFQINNQKIQIEKRDVLNFRVREFHEYKADFDEVYNSNGWWQF